MKDIKKGILIGLTITAIAVAIAVLLLVKKNDDSTKVEAIDVFANALEEMINEDGSFDYGYYTETHASIGEYNNLRHLLTSYALMNYYEEKGKLQEKQPIIENLLDYIMKDVVYKDEDTAYVLDVEDGEVKLGTCSMAVIAFCKHDEAYSSNKYETEIAKISNGIVSMQRLEGRFNHIFNSNNFRFREKDRTIYYEGEAVLALLRAYEQTKNEVYLTSAKKALDYYISKGYEKEKDHWQQYAVLELIKYDDKEKYFEYGFRNLENAVKSISSKEDIYNTDLETLKYGVFLCEKYSQKYEKNYENTEKITQIWENERIKLQEQLSRYKGDLVTQFFIENSRNTVRIDDLAHFLLALNKNY